MPLTDIAALNVPELPELEAAYWRGRPEFRALVQRLFDDTWRCAEPLPMLRFLQLLQRPTWAIAHRGATRDVKAMTAGLLDVLASAQARLIVHSTHDRPDEPNVIRFSWHSTGRKRQTWHYKAAALPDFLSMDRDGFAGTSELASMPPRQVFGMDGKAAERFHAALLAEYSASGRSKHRQDATLTAPDGGFIFVPMQLPNDSVIGHKLFEAPYLDGMRTAVAALAGAGHRVVVKRHPLCADPAVAQLLDALPPGAEASRASVHALLPACRAVVTLNSGVGFEALVYLKPVVAMGRCDYAAFAHALADPAGAAAAVEAATGAFRPRRVMMFLQLVLSQHQLDTRDPRAFQRQVLRALCWNYLETATR